MLRVFGVEFFQFLDLNDAAFVLIDFLEDSGKTLALSLINLLIDEVSLDDRD